MRFNGGLTALSTSRCNIPNEWKSQHRMNMSQSTILHLLHLIASGHVANVCVGDELFIYM